VIFTYAAEKIQGRLRLSIFLPLLLAALLTTWYGLFWSVDYFNELSSGLRFMDMQPALTVSALFAQIQTYDEATTQYYLWWSVFDYAWPFITFTTMLFISAWLLNRLSSVWQRLFPWLVGSAYLTVLMDWVENIGFAILVMIRPDGPVWLAQLTLLLHWAKLLFNMLFNLGFWIVLLMAIAMGIRGLVRRYGGSPIP
jgi:hypothetical protein